MMRVEGDATEHSQLHIPGPPCVMMREVPLSVTPSLTFPCKHAAFVGKAAAPYSLPSSSLLELLLFLQPLSWINHAFHRRHAHLSFSSAERQVKNIMDWQFFLLPLVYARGTNTERVERTA